MRCNTAGCERAAKKAGMCWACLRARSRNGTVVRSHPEKGVRHPTTKAMVQEAHEAYEDADPMDDTAQERAWARLRTAWGRYFERLGWRRPERGPSNTVQRPTDDSV